MALVHGFMVCGADDEAIRLGGKVNGSDDMDNERRKVGGGKVDLGGEKIVVRGGNVCFVVVHHNNSGLHSESGSRK